MSELNSEIPKDAKTVYVNTQRVFLEDNGDPFFEKVTETRKFNTYLKQYEKTPSEKKTEKVTPSEMGFTRKETWTIYIEKTDTSELENTTVYYEMELTFTIPEEARYRYYYFRKAQSGRVFLIMLESGVCSEVSINDKEFTTRGKAKRLPENTILKRGSPKFTLSSSGELERRLSENEIW
jgi:hypothetical protein